MADAGVALSVMAGLVPAIHDLTTGADKKSWMPGTRPGMTEGLRNRSMIPPER